MGWDGEGLLTRHGRVAQEARDFLLAELLLLISQQLVDELPKHLLGRCVQHRVDIDDEGVDVSGGGRRSKRLVTEGLTVGCWVRTGEGDTSRPQNSGSCPVPSVPPTAKTEKWAGRRVVGTGRPDSNPASATYQPSDLSQVT